MNKHLSRRTFIAAALGTGAAALARWDTHPDAVLYNGAILTMGSRVREVEALALSGSRVLAIGTSAEMLALAVSGTRRVDLGGKRVTPGFNDAHSHPGASGVALLTQVPLEMDSIEAIQAAIRAKAAATPPGQWVIGFLYDDTKTPRPLDRRDLDAAAPDHPVVVQHRGGHTAFVNSRALKLANIKRTRRILHMANIFATPPGATTGGWPRTLPSRSLHSPSRLPLVRTTAKVRRSSPGSL